MITEFTVPEFVAAVGAFQSADRALESGILRIAESLGAESAALVQGDKTLASVGTELALSEPTSHRQRDRESGPSELANTQTVRVDARTSLVVCGDRPPLDRAEQASAQAMARVLLVTANLLGELSHANQARAGAQQAATEATNQLAETRRQLDLLETLVDTERVLARGQPVSESFDAVVRRLTNLLDADLVGGTVGRDRAWIHIEATPTVTAGSFTSDLMVLAAIESALTEAGGRSPLRLEPSPEMALTVVHAPIEREAPDGDTGILYAAFENDAGDSQTAQATLTAVASQINAAVRQAVSAAELQSALRDPLTGLLNFAALHDRLTEIDESPGNICALRINLDGLGAINDAAGHAAGDELLKDAAGAIRHAGHVYDLASRVGGTDFALILHSTTLEGALHTARQLVSDIEGLETSDPPMRCRCHVGVSQFTSETSGIDLFRRAELALRESKANGTPRVQPWHEGMSQQKRDHRETVSLIHRGLHEDQFIVHYQPIVRLSDLSIAGAEALVRWNHPTRGLVSPNEFIDAAEQSGAIDAIGSHVLSQACHDLARWRRDTHSSEHLTISVNISPRQLKRSDLVHQVSSVLASSKLPPQNLILEITESIFVSDTDNVIDLLNQLRQLGVRLAIDDFGTGFSSLAYLQKYPFDSLKIDRAFVSGAASADGPALINTMVDLADKLHMTSTAEGIETSFELAQLRAMRCTYGQGYLFSRPVPSQTFETTINGETTDQPHDQIRL